MCYVKNIKTFDCDLRLRADCTSARQLISLDFWFTHLVSLPGQLLNELNAFLLVQNVNFSNFYRRFTFHDFPRLGYCVVCFGRLSPVGVFGTFDDVALATGDQNSVIWCRLSLNRSGTVGDFEFLPRFD